MRRLGGIGRWLLLAAVLVPLVGCGAGRSHAPVYDRAPRNNASHYVVQRGDTLYHIARYFGLNYRRLAAWNGIRTPYTIYPGQRLRLTAPPSVRRPVARRPEPAAKSAPAPAKPQSRPTPPPTAVQWRWPTDGAVARGYTLGDAPHKGIDIRGRVGQPVRAAAAGKVVYSGNGLSGYRQLVIIKHNDAYLSAYGHNRRVFVKEGDAVQAGQRIAEMGLNAGGEPTLHFEIRAHGKPIDPVRFLPKR